MNWYGTYYLTLREVNRFLRVYHQTVFTPVISALIFLSIFILSSGGYDICRNKMIGGTDFVSFICQGLIIMSIIQNSFANSSSSLIMSKIIGYIRDLFVLPLGASEIIISLTIGAVVRGVLVGLVVALVLSPFVNYKIQHPLLLIFYILASSSMLGKLGILAGILSESFDQNAAFTNYVITPLAFLSGTFYSVNELPDYLQLINLFNPFFYTIDGFRYCFTSYAQAPIYYGVITIAAGNILLYMLLLRLVQSGWRLKS